MSRHSAASRRPRWGPCAHRRRTVPAPLECGAEPRRRYDPECGSRVPRALRPPTSPTRLARRPRGRSSRLLQPSLSEARFQVALDATQQTWPDVFTRMNRDGRHTPAAFDAEMRAPLPALDTTEGPQDPPKVLRAHEIRIADGRLMCLVAIDRCRPRRARLRAQLPTSSGSRTRDAVIHRHIAL